MFRKRGSRARIADYHRLFDRRRLQRLVPQLAEGDPDHRWLAQAVSRYLQEAPAGLDLDRALG